ncbi:hypothetical protein [Pseudomonas sichuanensis]|uniref:hypothetical protein n=1 Tax=Pseudomonas sichuanensis TaxID=2213015 RepID=UPI00215DFF96|nr:hypothetical protein [Pseudomonas sichuanensis]UVL89461.1 hypothetical protein LOY51_00705 [Pseudomonas sichuanensis]
MKRSIEGLAQAGEPIVREALEAVRMTKDAAAPVEEVRWLKLLADSLYQAVTDYQLLGCWQSLVDDPIRRPRA